MDSIEKIKMNKKAQVTIFIILAVIIVAIVVILFIFLRPEKQEPALLNPRNTVQKCAAETIEKTLSKILDTGGVLSPQNKLQYNSHNYTYLCYQGDFYLPCYNLYPMLNQRIEEQLRDDTRNDIQNCFNYLREDFEKEGFSVSGGPTNYSIELLPGMIRVNLNKKIDISKGQAAQSFQKFDTEINSPLYELTRIVSEIVNSESQYCNFEYNGYMLLYPDYKITRIDYDGSKIYEVIDKTSGKKIKFAVRSCAFPPGL
jgi:hypothetical protein